LSIHGIPADFAASIASFVADIATNFYSSLFNKGLSRVDILLMLAHKFFTRITLVTSIIYKSKWFSGGVIDELFRKDSIFSSMVSTRFYNRYSYDFFKF